ncbi:hypothetical protein A8924_4851 [Saccharopolyspora erythraea NRRL 2338]|uniref:Uncharacterized protein n=2 Tax=Saccharopolyspora erythraea TaxID=1836 RepID=A4FI58_SACEN|nr:hypothetical protein [Saccharopolyspora erythraea]EQD86205.1 hypothetical protein N599_10885 [Saccharopolyspora erythraea D]PFG97414.1 hypothetical protein A8924_4851 [Saccharopolyspora erythraea NRRL 2338]QRK87593.1 hypothetical protein JQX30_22730 [Saccharopolyspora erythraea]CAM03733.1 hypothetical protein SACE_4464 [Saccharopolyspora erythraea NRRL 2338]
MIDHEWLERELALVNDELARRFPSVPRERVSSAVDVAASEYLPTARITNYLPILIERRARTYLSNL